MHPMKYSIIFFTIIVFANAVEVRNCEGSKATPLSTNDIRIKNCQSAPCTLKRRTSTAIEMKFTPKRDFKTLKQDIQGIILGVPLPFPGVYDTDACPFIYSEDGSTKVGCPLKAGTTYLYKNGFKILPLYPTVDVVVHWGLKDKIPGEDAVCFEIPARIK